MGFKIAVDVTIVYVDTSEDYIAISGASVVSKLASNELVYYGEVIATDKGGFIVYLTDKGGNR